VSTQCDIQPHFSFRQDKEVRIDFDGGRITSDAGLTALRQFDHLIGFTDSIATCLRDDRHPGYIVHSILALVIQRLYALIAGYEDQNDADLLRHDALFQLIADKPHLGDELASQPTLSRFENAISASEVGALNELLVESFIDSVQRPPLLIIELDSTDDPAHGQQQLIGFNRFYGQWMYHPLVIHEGVTGCILGTFLRPGNAHAAESAISALRPIIRRLKQAFPHTPIYLRADSGFEGPKLYELCESEGIDFTIAAGATAVYKRRSDDLLEQAVERYQATGRKARLYDHFAHQAASWDRQLRVLAKAEAGAEGTNRRFVVTNRPGDARCLFDFYERRGQHENMIKELKLDLRADRLSCHRFEANAFRLVLAALAYQLLVLFRRRLRNPSLRRATVGTLRERLFKVGALIGESTRRFWLRLSSSWPNRGLLAQALADLGACPAPG
jgi:hypothetical protein